MPLRKALCQAIEVAIMKNHLTSIKALKGENMPNLSFKKFAGLNPGLLLDRMREFWSLD